MSFEIVCRRDELSADGTRSCRLSPGAVDIFLVCRGTAVHAYVNSCPHTGASLDWNPGRFLDASGEMIQCATHGALFRIEDGYCVHGPCAGRSLTPVAVRIRDGRVEVDPGVPPSAAGRHD